MALTDNLISYWSMGEASGNATDAHGSNTLTDTNTVGSGTGKVGNARDFEAGNSEYFVLADNAALSAGDIDFTIACWVNLESLPSQGWIVTKHNGASVAGSEYGSRYTGATNRFDFFVYNTGAVQVTASNFGAPSTGTWYFLVCWHDSVNNQIGISVNDGTPNTASTSLGVNDTAANFAIGATGNGASFFDGLIDEVGFWKRVLTSGERTDLYNSGNGRDYAYILGGAGATGRASWHYHTLIGAT